MKRTPRTPAKLSLATHTVRALSDGDTALVAGGFSSDSRYNTCRFGGGCNSGSAYGGGSANYACG